MAEFVTSLPNGSVIGDIGCGNGKNIPACNEVGLGIGYDISIELCKICRGMGFEVTVGDTMTLPYRDGVFDAALSIAVLHHISSIPRRVRLIREVMRVVAVGGKGLFYAWAFEQKNAKSGHQFPAHDVLVPWHLKPAPKETGKESGHGKGEGVVGQAAAAAAAAETAADEGDASGSSSSTSVGTAGQSSVQPASLDSPPDSSSSSSSSNSYTVLLEGKGDQLGLGISTDAETCVHRVSKLLKGSAADSAALIKLGDIIVEVDGKSVVGVEHDGVIELLQSTCDGTASSNVAMMFLPAKSTPPSIWPPLESKDDPTPAPAPAALDSAPEDEELQEVKVYQRYCHVYREGELDKLASLIPEVELVESYYDTGNWCLVLRKVQPMNPANDFTPLTAEDDVFGGGAAAAAAAGGVEGGGVAAVDGVPVLDVSKAIKDLLDLSEGTVVPESP